MDQTYSATSHLLGNPSTFHHTYSHPLHFIVSRFRRRPHSRTKAFPELNEIEGEGLMQTLPILEALGELIYIRAKERKNELRWGGRFL
jgi:hypothetical protein